MGLVFNFVSVPNHFTTAAVLNHIVFFKRGKCMTLSSATYFQGNQRRQGSKHSASASKEKYDRSISLFVEHLTPGDYVIVPATVSFVYACGDVYYASLFMREV